MLLQDEDVTAPRRDHTGRRRCAWEAQPVGRQVEFRNNMAEHMQGDAAAAE